MNENNQKEMRKNFITTLYNTLDSVVSPTPYMEIIEGDNVDVQFLNGRGRLPSPNSTEITILDIDLASMFFDDFNILYEGVTGVGKTYTSDALFNTVFGQDGHYTIRLSGGVLGNSALEPFTTTTLENGIPKTRIDQEKCNKYGALFIDEINRGDSQEIFQVVDGKINVNGDTGYLRIPIPNEKGKYKGLAILAAMNPADAEHNAALDLDIAGENRFLKFKFPNGVAEAGSSQLEKKFTENLYEQFWDSFNKLSGTKVGWRELFPLITNPSQFPTELNGQTKEFIDVALGYVGYDPKETFQRNLDLIKQGNLNPIFSIREDNNYSKVLDVQGKLKHGFVRRDLRKIRDLSRLLSFIKGIKNETYDLNVGLNDVSAGIGVILESKTITGTNCGNLMALVNDARSSYDKIHNEFQLPAFHGFRQTAYQGAINVGQKNGFKEYLNFLEHNMHQINNQTQNTADATIKSRLLADLVVLTQFSKTYEKEIDSALKEKGQNSLNAFKEIYNKNKSKSSVYEHRLDSIMG